MTLLAVAATLAAAAPTPDVVLRNVQSTYERAGNIEASFTQTYVEKLRGKARSESGRLWASKDGRVRWEYEQPEAKYFIYDGKKAFFYEPENAQVTEFDEFDQSDLSHALRFLIGRGDLMKRFAVRACEKRCDIGEPGAVVVALWPKEQLPGVDHLLFAVDPKSWRVSKSVVIDPLGNRTEYAFTSLKFGGAIDGKLFAFEVPDGVSRLRATIGGDVLKPGQRAP